MIKYGYILEIGNYPIPNVAPIVPELGRYPRFSCLPESIKLKIRQIQCGVVENPESILGKKMWGDILLSFGGRIPDVMLMDDGKCGFVDEVMKFRIIDDNSPTGSNKGTGA